MAQNKAPSANPTEPKKNKEPTTPAAPIPKDPTSKDGAPKDGVPKDGAPKDGALKEDGTTEEPPLIEFKNGGIRLNFAGYHAEAGLGGLLTGSKTGGGLHVSAGTPSGASASAGLGGLFENGTIGGGLHARATLGNGGPEAKAGLGGVLGGNEGSASKTTGVLYADTNLREFVNIPNIPKIEKGVKHKNSKNIQVIPPAKPTTEKIPPPDTETNSVALKTGAGLEKEKDIPTALLYAFGNPKLTTDDEEKKPAEKKQQDGDQKAIERLKSTEKKIAEIDEILKPGTQTMRKN